MVKLKNKRSFLIISIIIIIIVLFISNASYAETSYSFPATINYDDSRTSIKWEDSNDSLINVTDDKINTIEEVSTFKDKNDVFYKNDTESRRLYASYADTIPTVTIDDWINWVNRKGYEVITFFQVIVQPFTMLIFIISAFLTLVGTISRGDLAGRGMWGMMMSAVIYATVLYAPVILNSFVGWVAM